MPIYAYLCDACGHEHDTLQKLSDPVLTICPVCHAERYRRKLTAAGFQLKGTGWYVTDFRDSGAKKPAPGADKGGAESAGQKDGASKDGASKDGASKDG
ncbi:MAG: zinc ribbon domain-containing protein, partial [Betaproteobacteria bacterium]|nr:zinc ribbon domain-containing protein [Betaproteobacteria bacterium]